MAIKTSPELWLRNHHRHFSRKLNEYNEVPVGPYTTTLPLIDRSGKILDMGMGNGMLLKFLMHFSWYRLQPYGVELEGSRLSKAKTEVLPDYADNFTLGNVRDYNYEQGPFNIIIADPFHWDPELKSAIETMLANVAERGRLIFRVHDDVLEYNHLESMCEYKVFKDFGTRFSRGDGLEFGVIDV